MSPQKIAKKIARLTLTKKAVNVRIFDLRKITDMTDFFVICSGETDIQVRAITDAVIEGMEQNKPWHKEGYVTGAWVLLDFVDVVIHIFREDKRTYYRLEELWGDAKITEVKDTFYSDSGEDS